MENIVNLEQLDYRDQLIKEYIDDHSSSGGGSSNYMDITVAINRPLYANDEQHAYLGVPSGTDVSDLSIKFLRHSCVRLRNKELELTKGRYNGLHEVWAIPQKDKVPLFNIVFKDKTNIDYQKQKYDFYEITGQIGDFIYDNMLQYVNTDADTGYYYKTGEMIPYGKILSHKKGGICLIRNDEIISNVALIRTVYDKGFESYRLTTGR